MSDLCLEILPLKALPGDIHKMMLAKQTYWTMSDGYVLI